MRLVGSSQLFAKHHYDVGDVGIHMAGLTQALPLQSLQES